MWSAYADLVLELIAKAVGRRDASLHAWLTPGWPLPPNEAFAHRPADRPRHDARSLQIARFVHRDLKPENVLVGADRLSNVATSRVRVTDFGLVRGLRGE